MDRKFVGAMLLLLASCGCRACNSCGDYLPPVLNGPYSYPGGRAGSALGVAAVSQTPYESEIINPSPQALPIVAEP